MPTFLHARVAREEGETGEASAKSRIEIAKGATRDVQRAAPRQTDATITVTLCRPLVAIGRGDRLRRGQSSGEDRSSATCCGDTGVPLLPQDMRMNVTTAATSWFDSACANGGMPYGRGFSPVLGG